MAPAARRTVLRAGRPVRPRGSASLGLHPVPRYRVTVDVMSINEMADGWVPEACTLPTVEQPMRVAEFDDLFRAALRTVDRPGRTHVVLGLDPAPGRADLVRALTRRETECCSFFEFTVVEQDGRLLLEVSVPPTHADVLDAIADRAAAGSFRA